MAIGLSIATTAFVARRTGEKDVRLNLAVMFKLLRVSATGIVQFLVATASWIGLVRVIPTFGSLAVAGYTIAIRLVIFTILPAWGFSPAAATLVGQNLGVKKSERAESSVYRTGFYNMLYLGLVSMTFLFFSVPLVSVFTNELQVPKTAVACLTILADVSESSRKQHSSHRRESQDLKIFRDSADRRPTPMSRRYRN